MTMKLQEYIDKVYPTPIERFPHDIYVWRYIKGLSQTELATKMGVTQKVVSNLETGRNVPNLKTMIKIAEALDLKITIHLQPKS